MGAAAGAGAGLFSGEAACGLAAVLPVAVAATVLVAEGEFVLDAGCDTGGFAAVTAFAAVEGSAGGAGCVVAADGAPPVGVLLGLEDAGCGFDAVVTVVGAAAVAVGAGVGVTVAETTLVLMLGDPASLVVDPAGGAAVGLLGVTELATDGAATGLVGSAEPVAAGAALAGGVCAVEAAVVAGARVLTVIGLLTTGAVALGGALVVTTIVEAAGGVRLLPGWAFCTVTEFAGVAVSGTETALCALGTLPAPGVPAPGNTVPCCRLPSFGCAAEGVLKAGGALVCALVADLVSGKLMGGNFGGTGIGAAELVVSGTEAGGLRWNTPISGAEAAGTGPVLRAAKVSLPSTRRVMVFPSAFRV